MGWWIEAKGGSSAYMGILGETSRTNVPFCTSKTDILLFLKSLLYSSNLVVFHLFSALLSNSRLYGKGVRQRYREVAWLLFVLSAEGRSPHESRSFCSDSRCFNTSTALCFQQVDFSAIPSCLSSAWSWRNVYKVEFINTSWQRNCTFLLEGFGFYRKESWLVISGKEDIFNSGTKKVCRGSLSKDYINRCSILWWIDYKNKLYMGMESTFTSVNIHL